MESKRRARPAGALACLTAAAGLLFLAGTSSAGDGDGPSAAVALQETRLTMDKWIETQQIISKERKDWQQGKEILLGRLDLVKSEVTTLEGKIR